MIGAGKGQADGAGCVTTLTTTITSGDLFAFINMSDVHMSDFCILNTAATGANAAIRVSGGQRNTFERLYIAGPFANQIQLDSSLASTQSTIWNTFRDVHTTGTAAGGTGCLFDSKDATTKTINSNSFWNVACTGGASGVGLKMTDTAHVQVINENVINCNECTASGGTAIQIDQAATRGVVFIDVNAEGSVTCFNKATANTVTFVDGNLSSCSPNVIDAQPAFTHFIGTNVGGITQQFAVTPIGDIYSDGLGINATPSPNSINGTMWSLKSSSVDQAFVESTGFRLRSVTFATLLASTNGTAIFCSDCNATCTAGASTGRTCFRENGAWTH